jgi:hypothetical protein
MDAMPIWAQIALPFATLLVGGLAATWRERRNKREDRISRVVAAYGRIAHETRYMGGLRGFVRAGAKTLRSSNEVHEAVKQIVGRYGTSPHPLDPNHEGVAKIDDLWGLIQEVDPDQPDWSSVYEKRGFIII